MMLMFNSSLTSAQFADCTLVFSIPITAGHTQQPPQPLLALCHSQSVFQV